MLLYLNDILINSKTTEEHKGYLRNVLDILRRRKFYLRLSKYNFGLEEVDYLGNKVSSRRMTKQRRLVKAVEDWPTPKNDKEVQRF